MLEKVAMSSTVEKYSTLLTKKKNVKLLAASQGRENNVLEKHALIHKTFT